MKLRIGCIPGAKFFPILFVWRAIKVENDKVSIWGLWYKGHRLSLLILVSDSEKKNKTWEVV